MLKLLDLTSYVKTLILFLIRNWQLEMFCTVTAKALSTTGHCRFHGRVAGSRTICCSRVTHIRGWKPLLYTHGCCIQCSISDSASKDEIINWSFRSLIRFTHDAVLPLAYTALLLLLGGNSPPPPVGQGLLIHEVSRAHTTTHHSL